jgi:3-dehydroquinate dehydratase / shikimate dehydrogenase
LAKKVVETQLCTAIAAHSPGELAEKAKLAFSLGSDLVEFRIDMLTEGVSPRELEAELSAFAQRAVFTVRPGREGGAFGGSEAKRLDLLSYLAKMKPAYLDVELSTAKGNKRWLESLPTEVERITSWHDFKGTPGLETLRAIREEEMDYGSLAKVVTTAGSMDDNVTTLSLCADEPRRTISFCMGGLGTLSRVVAMRLGAPLAYVSIPDEAVAPGQLSISTMKALRRMVI